MAYSGSLMGPSEVLEHQEKDLKGFDDHSTESVEEAPSQESERIVRGAGDITNLVGLTTGVCVVSSICLALDHIR
jgi:hypothetical protein